ncbi:MAG TPA: non-homologous end-joining DNA ligase, partial [Phycisphaerae bacterium]|nr:non-homologous end-joining DNA ligase [Phycisphaerae bacterium]
QKHIPHAMPAGLRGIKIREKSTSGVYPLIQNESGLVSLVQMNAVELHGWQSRARDLERPDQVIFDLDPGEGVKWSEVADTAFAIRGILQRCGLMPFLKTSGGKGLHLVVPLKPAATWNEVKGFAEAVSLGIAHAAPDRYADKMTKSIRGGRIYIDFHRNGRGATCVLPYSTRSRPGAPVSLPIPWEAVRKTHSASEFTIENVPSRIRRSRDPWKDFDKTRRPITRNTLASVGI